MPRKHRSSSSSEESSSYSRSPSPSSSYESSYESSSEEEKTKKKVKKEKKDKKDKKEKKDSKPVKKAKKSGYLLFWTKERLKVCKQHPNWPQTQVMSEVGKRWKKLPETRKKYWNTRASNL